MEADGRCPSAGQAVQICLGNRQSRNDWLSQLSASGVPAGPACQMRSGEEAILLPVNGN